MLVFIFGIIMCIYVGIYMYIAHLVTMDGLKDKKNGKI